MNQQQRHLALKEYLPNLRQPKQATVLKRAMRDGFMTFILSCALSLGAVGCAQAIEVGQSLALGQITKLDGSVFELTKDNNKNTLVQIWASWCPFCRRQNGYLQNFIQQIPEGSLNILTLSVDKEPDIAQKYMTDSRYSFAAAMMTPELRTALGRLRGIPILLILDPKGKVIYKEVGEVFEEDFADLVIYTK